MKNFIMNKTINYIKKNTDYNETKLKEIKYGLEGIYLTIEKLLVIVIISIILGIFKEMIIYLFIYNLLRMPSFGLHATKSWICLLSSTILFIGVPYLCIYLSIPMILKIVIGILGICFMFKNSPADTQKRPLVNKKRRKRYKIISTILAMIFVILSIIVKNNFISNCFIFSLIMQDCMISPIVYRIFKLPYNNYILFLEEHPDFQQ